MIEKLKEVLKDKLPYRISMSKTPRGSTLYIHHSDNKGNVFLGYLDFIPGADNASSPLNFFHIILETSYNEGVTTREVATYNVTEPLELSDFIRPLVDSLRRYLTRDERASFTFPELKVLL